MVDVDASKGGTLNVWLGKLKPAWEAYCEARGRKPSSAIREAIEAQLTGAESAVSQTAPPRRRQSAKIGAERNRKRYPVHLDESERLAAQERAAAEGMSMQRWVVACIRAALTHEPQFGMRELQALGESNYQLLAIGRNLNQIAKRLNEGRREQVTVAEIEALREVIDEHTQKVAEAMGASVHRWGIE